MKFACALALTALLAVATNAAPLYEAMVVKKIPHSRQDFTQGLEIRGNRLYQGTGQYGESRLQMFDLETGTLLRQIKLPDRLFGEGITLLDNKIYQLTWRAGIMRIYAHDDFKLEQEVDIGGEGWGLTNDGDRLIMSDGSDRLRFLSNTGEDLGGLKVRYRGRPLKYLNELEWTPDYLLANIWGKDWIVMIDLDNGEVTGRVDLTGLLPRSERRRGTDVLNGIAYDHQRSELWVTGKNWPWIYQVELRQK